LRRHLSRREDPAQQHLPILLPYRNCGLFADYFLESPERLRKMPDWNETEGLREAFDQLSALFKRTATRLDRNPNERQTEEAFIQPALAVLWGQDQYEVQEGIPGLGIGQRRPDYAFFRSAGDRDAAQRLSSSPEFWRNVPCLGDAKKWEASLDRQEGSEKSPSAQITDYLYRSRVRWGILTNGRLWRLYEQDRSRPGGIFYEVDLVGLLKQRDMERFKFFWLFFRRAAFDPGPSGRSFVDEVLQGSAQYATGVGERLKESVYDALCHLVNGFVENPANALDPRDPATLKAVHDNCLILLYRLLFILYAEDRGLVPRREPAYAEVGLSRLQGEINERLRSGEGYAPVTRKFWNHLCDLFRLIDQGYPKGHIPAYNGGLFSPEKNPHIAYAQQPGTPRWEIGDDRLAQVIDMLAYRRERWDQPGTDDVDYTTLAVQHLGSIYEGLLELQPRVADEPMVETTQDGKPVFRPAREVPNPKPIRGQPPHSVAPGEVYLVTHRGERKATGSYYTPKYIVDYIVENTVGPLADEAARKVAELRPQVDSEIRKLQRTRKQRENGSEKLAPAYAAKSAVAQIDSMIEKEKWRLLGPYLDLKILDPAMGSGHFLVGAADFLSLAMATDPNLLLLAMMGDEDPQAFYKRLVVERCLYGVDLNPLAVELGKLSLWLHTVSRDKALSFLDHHLRCGNSLLGARIEDDLRYSPPQLDARGRLDKKAPKNPVLGFAESLTGDHLRHVLDTFRRIVEAPSGDADVERQKDKWYWEMDAARDRFRAVANLWIAPYFDVPITPDLYGRAVAALRGTPAEWETLAAEPWFSRAQALAHARHFFHWELEFPEAFFGLHGFNAEVARGFDCAIGNPPFGKIDKADPAKQFPDYSEVAVGMQSFKNYALLFGNLTYRLAKAGGLMGILVPKPFAYIDSWTKLRQKLLDRCTWAEVVDCSEAFRDVRLEQVLYACRKGSPPMGCLVSIGSFSASGLLTDKLRIPQSDLKNDDVVYLDMTPTILGLVRRIKSQGTPLGHHFDVYKTVRNQTILEGLADSPTEWPVYRGESISRWRLAQPPSFLQYDPSTVAVLQEELRRVGQPHVVAQRIIAHVADHIVLMAAWYDVQALALDTVMHFLPKGSDVSPQYLMGILNSRLCSWYVHRVLYCNSVRSMDFVKTYADKVPIRGISTQTAEPQRRSVVAEILRMYEQGTDREGNRSVLAVVSEHLIAAPQRADVVHDVLACLAEKMVEMNRAKHEEVRGFLGWLERETGAKVEALANKTAVRGYHEHDLKTLLDVLRQNRRKLGTSPDGRAFQEALDREFGASVERLGPLKARLAATDRLIDQIVYRLYGLTEEEIAIVEGAQG